MHDTGNWNKLARYRLGRLLAEMKYGKDGHSPANENLETTDPPTRRCTRRRGDAWEVQGQFGVRVR